MGGSSSGTRPKIFFAEGGKGRDITKDDLIMVGTGAGISKRKCEQWYDEVLENIKPLKKYIDNTGFGKGRHISFSERLGELTE